MGEGWGEGILPNHDNLSQHPNRPNTSLVACCPLSNSLPRERGRGSCWDEGFCKANRLCMLLFFFSDDLQSTATPRKPSPSYRVCAVRTHAFSIFPATPTHRVHALRHTPYRWVQRSSEKISRRLFHLPCDKRLPEKFLLLMFRAFFFRRPVILESAAICPLPRGGGLGRGHLRISATFQHLNLPNTSLAACCPLSSSLPRGERTG